MPVNPYKYKQMKLLTIKDFAASCGLNYDKVYNDVRAKKLKTTRVGRMFLIDPENSANKLYKDYHKQFAE